MYCKMRSTLRVENCFSDTFNGNVVVDQGSFVCPLLLIMVLNLEKKVLGVNMRKTEVMLTVVNELVVFASQEWKGIQFIAQDKNIGCTKTVVEFASD